jgi:hypothetical protein
MCWLRYPKTTQERRRWFADLEEGVRLRRSRAPMSIPTAWDDIGRHAQRSWKEQRRTKWRRIKSGELSREVSAAVC